MKREDLSRIRILVVGDVMLDRYWFGEVSRISPEAPVPVVKVTKSEERLGGAANVARNISALGATATLLSVVGPDEAGNAIRCLLESEGIESRLHVDENISTTIKLRVIGRQQQLLRVDFETMPSHEILAAKLDDFEKMVKECDAVILSDYGKGGLLHISRMIEQARRNRKRVLVDPKGDDYLRYSGASILTPNRTEFREVAGAWKNEEELRNKGEILRRELGLEALLITRSEEGMTLISNNPVVHIPAQAREVFDVSGAGDTVIATLGVALSAGVDYATAATWANKAGGIVVGKLGTAVVTADELFE